jgi:hypothetical protein
MYRSRLAACATSWALTTVLLTAGQPSFTFSVVESCGVPRHAEVVCSGLPLPRQANVLSATHLQVLDARGQQAPARFHVLARWNAGRDDTNAPLQWVLVEMPVSLEAYESRTFQLVPTPTPSAPVPLATALRLSQTNGVIHIETGTARFVMGGNPALLFDEIRVADNILAATGRPLLAVVNSNQTTHAETRRVQVERQSDLAAVVVAEGCYDLPAIGEGRLSTTRRYQFFAGSGTALIRQEVAWEGNALPLGVLASEGVPNGLRVQLIRDGLSLSIAPSHQALVWGEIGSAPLVADLPAGATATIEQRLRPQRTAPRRFELQAGTSSSSGAKATAGLLAVSDGSKTIGLALNHLHRYEPQALRYLPDGSLAVDVASDQTWLGARQGLFANFGITVHPGGLDATRLKSALWAQLNHPLRAWPTATWFAGSKAVEEFPVGDLPEPFQDYDRLVRTTLTRTLEQNDQLGLSGLQTYGLFPRYWGSPEEGYDEVDHPEADPTPAEDWDDAYWGATWTDYHNTSALATYWAMRSGDCHWLDEIAWPAAWRMLHTQIIHGAPDDSNFYIGQAPCGYGGYRADFNSSHAYFDNLLLYYWLTGDYSVVETLQRGARSMRQFLYPERPDVPCDPLRPAPNEWAYPVGRVASQWIQVFRFLGLASADASYLEDYRGNLARAVSQHYAELEQDGRHYGFWCSQPVSQFGTHHTDQIWMASLYDLNNLHRWLIDSGDQPLGSPPLRPSRVISAWSRTLAELASFAAPGGDGTAQGAWPNMLEFVFSGERLGGRLLSVTNHLILGVDNALWDTGKANLCAVLGRAADYTQDPSLRQLAADLTSRTMTASWAGGNPRPLGKVQGLYFSRLHAAVARQLSPGAIRLNIRRQDGQVLLDWPGAAQSWRLETTPTLEPVDWRPVAGGIGALEATVNISAPSSHFYRLAVP